MKTASELSEFAQLHPAAQVAAIVAIAIVACTFIYCMTRN